MTTSQILANLITKCNSTFSLKDADSVPQLALDIAAIGTSKSAKPTSIPTNKQEESEDEVDQSTDLSVDQSVDQSFDDTLDTSIDYSVHFSFCLTLTLFFKGARN